MNGPEGLNTIANNVVCVESPKNWAMCGAHGGTWVGTEFGCTCCLLFASPAEIAVALTKLKSEGGYGRRER